MPNTGKPIDKETISKIADLIEKREDFISTLNEDDDKEFLHSYNALRIMNTIVIRSDFWTSPEYSRQFLIYDERTGVLRETHDAEDEMLRAFDDGYDFLDLDKSWEFTTTFIICRNKDNSVERGDHE